MLNWYEFKKLYSASHPNDCLFHAYVVDKDTYRIVIDENNIFKEIFLSIIKGTYKMYPLEHINGQIVYREKLINTNNAIDNLKEYINLQSSDTLKNKFILKKTNIVSAASFQFKGPDFNYEQGMLPSSVTKASKIVYGFTKALSSNKEERQNQFLFSKAGSLIFDIQMPDDKCQAKVNVMQNLINMINNPSLYNGSDEINLVIKYLYELTKIKNLDSFNIILSNGQPLTIDLDNVKRLYQEIHAGSIEIEGVPDSYSNKNNSFRINKYSCYLQNPEYNTIKMIKQFCEQKNNIRVSGRLKNNHAYTIEVASIEYD